MVDFGESDKMIKISKKWLNPNTYKGFRGNISILIHKISSSD